MVKVNNFGSYPLLDRVNFICFSHVIKVEKREILRIYCKHICVPLLFSVFAGKLPLGGQSE